MKKNYLKIVVFIETNFSGLDAFLYCKNKGYKSVLVTDDISRYSRWFPKSSRYKLDYIDEIISVKDSNNVNDVVFNIKKNIGVVDAVLTFADIRVRTVASICKELSLKGTSVESIDISQNKSSFRKTMIDSDVDNVSYRLIKNANELTLIKRELNYPFFIKPNKGHSSLGAFVCHAEKDIDSLIERLNKLEYEGVSRELVIEDYLVGEIISVEVITSSEKIHNIIGISDRKIINESIEIGSSFPIKNREEEIINKAKSSLNAVGYDFGPSHIEMIITKTGIHLIEINARVGGSGHSVMMDLSTGSNIVGDCIDLCLGLVVSNERLSYTNSISAAWECFISNKKGVIRSFPNINDVKRLPGVKEVWEHAKIGDINYGIDSNFSWIAQVMCTGKNNEDARKNAENAVLFIKSKTFIQ
ncbi:ATP-grasp domain-containing protein [Marinomonas sp. 2405UD68-3]|uniref:ATP-grasp domain-containing protein n=1 Tax=Marinomonas sp. 2405UD68-3 TaxID=3391835 RepID=UPI0039C9CA6F